MSISVVDVAKPLRRSRLCFQRFRLAITRRRICHQIFEEMVGDVRDLIHGAIEGGFVGLRRFGESGQFTYELKRGGSDLIIRRGRRKIMQGLNISAHEELLTADYADENGFVDS